MSNSLRNLLVQISKTLVYSKIKFYSEKNFFFTFGPIGPAASRPSCGPPIFFNRPLPLSPLSLGRPSRPARQWRLTQLPPSSWGSASSRAAFALSSRPADRWTPPVIPHLQPARARPRHHHLPPLPAPPSSNSDAAQAFTTPPSLSPSLIPLLTSPPPSMALTPLTPSLLPRSPLSGAPPAPIKGQ
jgi:hypothetical protein